VLLEYSIKKFFNPLIMKRSIFVLSILFFVGSTNLHAQKCYLGVGTGINNASGMVGVLFEAPINSHYSAKLGAGLGSWGSKISVSAKYYKEFPTSISFGLGYSTASGVRNVEYEVELMDGTKNKEEFNLYRAHMIDFTIGKSWGQKVRFNIECGYSLKIAGGNYKHLYETQELSEDSKTTFDMITPGGLIIGLGLTFAL
jgi:hypothetical protein